MALLEQDTCKQIAKELRAEFRFEIIEYKHRLQLSTMDSEAKHIMFTATEFHRFAEITAGCDITFLETYGKPSIIIQ